MIDVCANHREISAQQKKFKRKSFLKKPLVAISLLVVITMCLSLAEAAPRPTEHRRRHHRTPPRPQPARAPAPSPAALAAPAALRRRHSLAPYKNAVLIITRRLRHTDRRFKQDLMKYRQGRKHKNGKPEWLPRLNFSNLRSFENDSLDVRFNNWMPKLYKHLRQYQELFRQLAAVELVRKDSYVHEMSRRRRLLELTRQMLGSVITEVTDSMESVNLTVPELDTTRFHLETLQMRVDATKCEFQDDIAYRGYQNLLNNWILLFKCIKNNINNNKKLEGKCKQFNNRFTTKESQVVGRKNKFDQGA